MWIPRVVASLLLVGVFAAPLRGERVPVAAFGSEDGLGHDHVRCAVRDGYGLLWFCTAVGLARFDGVAMTPFGPADGLPEARVHDLLIVGGRYLAATDRGIYALDAGAWPVDERGRFTHLAVRGGCADQPVHTLGQGGDGGLWMGCDDGLFAGSLEDGWIQAVPLDADLTAGPIRALVRGDDGTVWAGGAAGLIAIPPGALPRPVEVPPQWGEVLCLLLTRNGETLYVGFERGLGILATASTAESPSVRPHPGEVNDERRTVRALYEDPAGILWVGAVGTLFALDGGLTRAYSVTEGLRDETVNGMTTDRAGNLWLGTDIGGAIRWQRDGLVTFGTGDGMSHASVSSLTTDRRGRLVVGADARGGLSRRRPEASVGARFTGVSPAYPPEVRQLLRHGPVQARQTRDGSWWLATGQGLFRFAATDRFENLQRFRPRRFGVKEGLPSDSVRVTYEDAAGNLWAMTGAGHTGALARHDAATGRFEVVGPAHGLPPTGGPTVLLDDDDGRLWVGWSDGTLLVSTLLVGDGHRFSPTGLVAGAAIWDLMLDVEGRLWVATHGDGVYRLAPVDGRISGWHRYGRDDGLASDVARCLVADRWGRIYIGGVRGIDRLDPETGQIRSFTTAHGLAQLEITAARADLDGNLWFGTWGGLSRLVPRRDSAVRSVPPEARIASLSIDGRAVPLSVVGHRRVGPIRLAPGRHRVDVGYFAVGASADAPIRYRYRIHGGDWSYPSASRSLALADLGPGEHRLQLTAAEDPEEGEPAVLTVVVGQPFWRRGWFLVLVAATFAAGLVAVHRTRLRRALAVERIRTRIAADLHDDLGASLSRISLLSEAAHGRLPPSSAGTELPEMLEQIGVTARRLTGRAREIVWSLDPRFDDLASFAVRIRETAGELLEPAGIAWSLDAPRSERAQRVRLREEQRQHLLLVFKEAMHNVQRHAGARRVELLLRLDGRTLRGSVRDDGRGFDPTSGRRRGHGLENMASRIDALGGGLEIGGRRDGDTGTEVRFEVPLA
ncbi:MAG: histidine kinase [Acidobacteriota bacterium]